MGYSNTETEYKELLYGYPSDIVYHNKRVGISRSDCNSLFE